jgi:hypothetical protein
MASYSFYELKWKNNRKVVLIKISNMYCCLMKIHLKVYLSMSDNTSFKILRQLFCDLPSSDSFLHKKHIINDVIKIILFF